MRFKNAFLLTDDPKDIEKGKLRGVTEFTVATRFPMLFEGLENVTVYKCVYGVGDSDYPRLALMTMLDENAVDEVINAVYDDGAKVILACAYSLDEAGTIESRYHLSPIQLAHKLGLLQGAIVVGGVHLDRDDVDLMAQSETSLVLCITSSMGYGYGFPHFVACKRKLKVTLGSGDNAFNGSGDMIEEAKALVLGSNCDMRSSSSVSANDALALVTDDDITNAKEILFG